MKKQWLRFLLIFLALLPVLLLRDFTPDNELKYLSIADEAIANGHIFAFYNHGVAYADKPPLYLWAVILGKLLFGQHVMLFLSLLSVIPAFITVFIMDKWVRKQLSENETVTGELLLFSTVFFLAPMIVLRMDMLMTMFITLALYTFYRMYEYNHFGRTEPENAKKYRRMQIALPLYIFFALFTKGPVGILVPLISILVFLSIKREIKSVGKYLGWKTWVILGALCAVWFTGVYLDGGKEYLNNLLFNQTVNRAVDAFHHKKPFWYYGIAYWFTVAPWSVLAFTVILIGYRKKLINTDMIKLFATVVLSTILMLSAISSKIEIYLLPCFPFLLYMTALLLPKLGNNIWIRTSIVLPAVIFILVFIISCFTGLCFEYKNSPEVATWAPVQLFTGILMAGGAAAIFFICKKKSGAAIKSIAISMFVLIFTASFSLPSFNNMIGMKAGCERAMELAAENGIKEFVYYDFKAGDNFDVYLGQQLKRLSKEELPVLSEAVLFVKTRDIERDSVLNAAVGHKETYEYGEFSIIPFK